MNMVILCKELIGRHSLLRPFPVARSFSLFRRVPFLVRMTGRMPLFSQKRCRMVESKEVLLLTMKARRILASAHTSYTHSTSLADDCPIMLSNQNGRPRPRHFETFFYYYYNVGFYRDGTAGRESNPHSHPTYDKISDLLPLPNSSVSWDENGQKTS
jgi:hypothetical protein